MTVEQDSGVSPVLPSVVPSVISASWSAETPWALERGRFSPERWRILLADRVTPKFFFCKMAGWSRMLREPLDGVALWFATEDGAKAARALLAVEWARLEADVAAAQAALLEATRPLKQAVRDAESAQRNAITAAIAKATTPQSPLSATGSDSPGLNKASSDESQ